MKNFLFTPFVLIVGLWGEASAASNVGRNSLEAKSGTDETPRFLNDRTVCRADHVLRALRDPARAATATPFCQTFINVPTSTGTVTFTPIL